MQPNILAFLCGILLLQIFSFLPSLKIGVVIAIFSSLLLFKKSLKHLSCVGFGFVWVLFFVHWQQLGNLPTNWEGKSRVATGYIASIPSVNEHGVSFLFRSKKPISSLVKLTWHSPPSKLHVGDEWCLTMKLKKIHGVANPGGFDFEAYALQEGLNATGSVVDKGKNVLISSYWYHFTLGRLRQMLGEKIAANVSASRTSPWITALTIGERNNIASADWEILRNTGTNHLMAIAGLHIGFMAFLAHAITSFCWRRIPRLALRFPAVQAGAVASLMMAFLYSALAGFSLPTQRACAMLFVFLAATLARRKIVAWRALSIALLFVLLINPLSVLTESFWLSFGSVALIIYGVSGRLSPSGWWWKLGRIQWVIALGLLPLSLWLFHQFSLISFLANSITIPLVGFLVVPLCFLGAVLLLFSIKGSFVLLLADKILSVVWWVLERLSHLSDVVWYLTAPNWMVVVGVIGVLFLLLPVGFPGRFFGLVGLLPLVFYQASTPLQNELRFTLLDVGQGLSAFVQTKNHALLFDAGPRSGNNFDMGESVVLPFLRSTGVKQLDMVVVSHGDNDHIGGIPSVITHLPTKRLVTSDLDKLPNAKLCLRGEEWNWDGVNFSFIYPTKSDLGLNNDSSCVLRITVGKQHILLTGDIEEYAEEDLLLNEMSRLRTTILVAPHHGSKTSGLSEFVNKTHPDYVFYPVGYKNRYHLPSDSVMNSYKQIGSKQYDSVTSGAIQVVVNDKELAMTRYRLQHLHYWSKSG